MADTEEIGPPESSEDGSISLTSADESDGEGGEYAVDCILAEWETDGVMWYLTKWDGYADVHSTWQLRDTFNPKEEGGHDVFKEWQQKKMRICRGYEEAYDIEDWERRRDKLKKEIKARKDRRRREKAKLDRMVEALPSDSDETIEKLDENRVRKGETKNVTKRISQEAGGAQPTDTNDGGSSLPVTSWTNTERQVFVQGLQAANGLDWEKIDTWYGQRGTISCVLKNKSPKDLQRQLQVLRREFVEAGREPPGYMNIGNTKPDIRVASQSPKRRRRTRKVEEDDADDSGTSFDSVMEELAFEAAGTGRLSSSPHDKKNKPELKLDQVSEQAAVLAESPWKQPSDVPERDVGIDKGPPKSDSPVALKPSKPPGSNDKSSDTGMPRAVSSKHPVSNQKPAVRAYSGTARVPTTKPAVISSRLVPSRTGTTGARTKGPLLFPTSDQKPKSSELPQKRSISGVDVTANWSGQPKIRKQRTLPTTNAAADPSKPVKTFKTLGVRNSIQKWRRNEPAPDPATLIFVDPKTGKSLKPLSSPPAASAGVVAQVSKTPFQQFQEDRAIKEAEERRQVEQIGITTNADSHDRDCVVEDAGAGVHAGPSNTSGDAISHSIKINSTPIPDAEAVTISPLSLPHSPGNLRAPPNAPSGPRTYQYTRDMPPALPKHRRISSDQVSPTSTSGMANTYSSVMRPRQPENSRPLKLIGNPTPDEKNELFAQYEPNLVIGSFKVGPALESLGKTKLAGFGRDVQRLLLSIKDSGSRNHDNLPSFEFQHICSAPEYRKSFHSDTTRYLGSGYVVPYADNRGKYESTAELLALHLSAGVFFAKEFTMVIWPANASVWEFLEKSVGEVPAGAVLRFAVREPLIRPPGQEIEPPVTSRLQLEDSELYGNIKAKVNNAVIEPGEMHINVVFRDMFDIDYNRLIATNGQKTVAQNFFLCFYPAGCEKYEPDNNKRRALRWRSSEEHDLFLQFLNANGAENVFSMQNKGSHEVLNQPSWSYFLQNFKSGVILIHDRCGRIDQLPYLGKILQGPFNVWMTSFLPIDPVAESHPHLVRLFPHGGVILVTISLMLYHPHEALRILRWFRLCQLPCKPPGTWKVGVRPRYLTWLNDLMDLCCEETGQSPFGYHGQVYADIYTEIIVLLTSTQEPIGLMMEDDPCEIPDLNAPLLASFDLVRGRKEWTGETYETAQPDDDAIRWNDEELIHWFAQWAGTHLDEHRRFTVALGYPPGDPTGDYVKKCYQKGYGYLEDGPDKPGRQEQGRLVRSDGVVMKSAYERNFLEIMSYEHCAARYQMKDQEALEKMHLERAKKEKEFR